MTIIRGTHDENTLEQMDRVAASAAYTALMADGHRGYVMPIGGVAAYRNRVSLNGVGVDIACGNAAIKTNLTTDSFVMDHLPSVADAIVRDIGFGMGSPTNPTRVDHLRNHPLFDSPAWDLIDRKQRGNLQDQARAQLGTVGGGNHYVDVFQADDNALWVGCHFGSRGLGFRIAHAMMALAQGVDHPWRKESQREVDMDQHEILDLDTELGQMYWQLMSLAGEYAYAGRNWVVSQVTALMGGETLDKVHNHHNFAWKEKHFGEELVVVRKGATPAFPGQRGFVGGSMGDSSVILKGADPKGRFQSVHIPQRDNLYSTVHGAGRVMGRMAAKGKWKKGVCTRPGLVSRDDMDGATRGLILRGGDLDEAPQVYRKLADVLEAQGPTIEVETYLDPLIVCMAPSRTRRGR